jgi:hypothetical protein
MGKNSIEAGSKDYWTKTPSKVEMANELIKSDPRAERNDSIALTIFDKVYKNPQSRDPRAYIIPINQTTTAVNFVNILLKSGIRVEKATADFTVGNKKYLAGSYIVKTNQAFRPHVIDMFDPQDHPNDFQYPGGPPVRPYDAAGWTPAYTMGLEFDRILEPFDGPFQTLPYGVEEKAVGSIEKKADIKSYQFSTKENASFILVNDLLKAGVEVEKTNEQFIVKASATANSILEKAAAEYGVKITSFYQQSNGASIKLKSSRIALWDVYGGSMPSGWTRWIFEQYRFPFTVVYAKEIDAGKLKSKYDVIVFVGGAIPAYRAEAGAAGAGGGFEGREPNESDIPEIYRASMGRITAAKSIPALKEFAEAGGTIVTIGSSANLAYHFNLPVRNALVEMVNGKERPLPGEKFYIPGSVMQVAVNPQHTANWGMKNTADVYFSASPVFNLMPDAIANGDITPLAWFASDKTLRSGWAFGQSYLQNGVAAFSAKVGKGKLLVYGPEISFRGQTHSTYKMLFNQLYGQD